MIAGGAIAGIGGALQGALGAIGDIVGIDTTTPKQHAAERLRINAIAFSLAMNGSADAFRYLKAKGGMGNEKFPYPGGIPGLPDIRPGVNYAAGGQGAWVGSEDAPRTDARQKVAQLQAAAAAGSGGAATAVGAQGASPAGEAAKEAAKATAASLAGIPSWAWVAIAGAVAFTVIRPGRAAP